MPGAIQGARAALSRPVSPLSLAIFRIAIGALLVWDCWRFIRDDRIHRYYAEPEFHFTYAGFGWVTPLPEPWIYWAWLLVGVSAFCVMLGLFFRIAIVVLTVTFSYFFLLDKAEYLNHFYLVVLFLLLLCVMPAHRALSLDALRRPAVAAESIPYAAVFMLRAQMEIMLIFAGLVKISPDWLAGEPLGLWLRAQADDVFFGALFAHDWLIIAATWGTVALHILGAPLLLWQRTRLAVFCVYCVFHSANAFFFNIGIFPWLTIAATTIFFAPDWPRRFLSRVTAPDSGVPTPGAARFHLPSGVLLAMASWLAVQIVLPLRAAAFDSDVRWSGDGHRFSWRMRIFDRKAEGMFLVSADGKEWVVNPTDFLTPRQADKMMVRSDMVHQFAGHIADIWRKAGYGNVEVRAEILKSLNGRSPQLFLDPETNLTAARYSLLRSDAWVMPLVDPVQGVAEYADVSTAASHGRAAMHEASPLSGE